jgi:hypothetical protein
MGMKLGFSAKKRALGKRVLRGEGGSKRNMEKNFVTWRFIIGIHYCDQIKKYGRSRACSDDKRVKKLKNLNQGDLRVDDRIILKWNSNKQHVRMWTGFVSGWGPEASLF